MTDQEMVKWLQDCKELLERKIERDATRIKKLVEERNHWSGVAGREGVCMTCSGPNGAPEPYGCTDCLNTGYCGEYHNTMADLEAKLAKAVAALRLVVTAKGLTDPVEYGYDTIGYARATLAELEGK